MGTRAITGTASPARRSAIAPEALRAAQRSSLPPALQTLPAAAPTSQPPGTLPAAGIGAAAGAAWPPPSRLPWAPLPGLPLAPLTALVGPAAPAVPDAGPEPWTPAATPSVQALREPAAAAGTEPAVPVPSVQPAADSAAPGLGATAAGAVPAGQSDRELDDLARRLYGHLRTQLRLELLVDRERAGLLADQR